MDGAQQADKKTQVGRGTLEGGRGTANAEVVEKEEHSRAVDVGYDRRNPIDEGIEDFCPGAPIEAPEKNRRRLNRSLHTSAAATSAATSSSIMLPSSPGMSWECREESSSPVPPPRPLEQNALQEDKTDILINYGSELEDSDDEGVFAPYVVPRIQRFLLDTPQDEDDTDDAAPVMDSHPSTATGSSPHSTTSLNTEHNTDSNSSGPAMGPNFYDFVWKPFPNPPLDPELRRETFSESNVGPTTPRVDPYDIFIAIWDRQIMEHIVSETNKYARELADLLKVNNALYPENPIAEWRDTTTDELYTYLAIVLGMGCMFKLCIEDYWSADSDILSTPFFSKYMTLRRFKLLSKCLHFNRNENLCALKLGSPEAKLFKVKPVVSHLNKKFQQMYNLERDLVIDESLLQWRSRTLGFDQRLLKKAAFIGLKTYEVCESQTGYLWRFEVHTCKGSQKSADPLNLLDAFTPKIVLKLLQGLENKGHTLWMDSFYNSPALARKLKTLGFDCVGTLRTNRQFVPKTLNQLTKDEMQPGMVTGLTSGDVDVMVWRDTNRVATISTYYGNTVAQKDGTTKPTLFLDYKFMMRGMDNKDRMLSMFPLERKREKFWYKKFFRRLLNVSVLNAYIICKKSSSDLDYDIFRKSLVTSLLNKHGTGQMVVLDEAPDHLSIRYHHLAELPFLPGKRVRQRRPCDICKKRVQTYCVGCDKSVCMTPCFVDLHD